MAPKTAAEGAVWLQTAVPRQRPHPVFLPGPPHSWIIFARRWFGGRFIAAFPIVQIKKAESEAVNKCAIRASVEAATVQINTSPAAPRRSNPSEMDAPSTHWHPDKWAKLLTRPAHSFLLPRRRSRLILLGGVCNLPLLMLYYVGVVLTRLLHKAPDSAAAATV